jgi:hypothetical protein
MDMKTKRFLSVFFLALLLMGQLAVPVQAARVSPPEGSWFSFPFTAW